MYRIRLANGEEAAYRTAKELTTAVASGVVNPTAEVFHTAGNRWLPIHLHPDYKLVSSGKQPALGFPTPLAVAAPGEDPAKAMAPIPHAPRKFARSGASTGPGAAVSPAPGPLTMESAESTATRAAVQPPVLSPVPSAPPVVESPQWGGEAAVAAPTPVPSAVVPGYDSRARKLRIMLSLAMGLVGVISLGGTAIFVAPYLKRGVADLSRSLERREGMDPAPEALVPRVDPGLGPFPAPSAPNPVAAAARLDSLIAYRPSTRTTQLRASRPRILSYAEAYADARDEMDTGLDYINFRRVFDGYRFANPDSLRAARRMVSAAGNILRVYRGREVMLEQSYRADDPGGQGSLRESFETAEASRALISDVDRLFGLLVAAQGRFSWTDTGLKFQEARTAKAYLRLRLDILNSLAAWRDSTPGPNRATYPRLMAGLGRLGPPPAR
ncbi:MAG: hypothetical protein ABI587_04160 [Gemmatimonadales bacterium]